MVLFHPPGMHQVLNCNPPRPTITNTILWLTPYSYVIVKIISLNSSLCVYVIAKIYKTHKDITSKAPVFYKALQFRAYIAQGLGFAKLIIDVEYGPLKDHCPIQVLLELLDHGLIWLGFNTFRLETPTLNLNVSLGSLFRERHLISGITS